MTLGALLPFLPGLLGAGLVTGLGLWSMWSTVTSPERGRQRTDSIVVRVASALRDVSGEARDVLRPQLDDPVRVFGRIAHPVVVTLAHRLDKVVGGGTSTRRLLQRAGVDTAPADYAVERLVWTGGGMAVGLLASGFVVASQGGNNLIAPVGGAIVGGLAGVWWPDRQLQVRASKRHDQLLEEFPTVVELLALTLSAGQSLPNALERVARRAGGALGQEWRRVLSAVDLGAPLGATLRESAAQMAVPEISALVDHLVYALERGAPLTEVVRAHSGDARADRLRAIVERSGKAEIAMLVPLVLLILPITVLFAVWPSLQALQFGL